MARVAQHAPPSLNPDEISDDELVNQVCKFITTRTTLMHLTFRCGT
jgi:hypothetical protein